jgi:GTP-sensing pleiotropic transcriptional regulator CodY
VDSVGGISAWVGDTRENVLAALEKLVESGVLNKDSEGGMKGYCYTRDEKTMKMVEELLKSDAGS